MKYTIFLSVLLFVVSCTSDKSGEKSESPGSAVVPTGKYYRIADNDRAGTEGIMDLVTELEFKKNYCHFTYVTTRMSGKYEVDEGYIYINTGGELGTLSLEIINSNHLEGEGYIHGTFKRERPRSKEPNSAKEKSSHIEPARPEPVEADEMEEVQTKEEGPSTKIPSSARYPDHRNSNVETNPSSSDGGTNNNNPFAGGFGEGGRNEPGPGTNGTGPDVISSGRKVLRHLESNDIQYNHDVKLYFRVAVNADGYVVDVQNIKSKTNTNDQQIIRKVASLIKSQVRYSKQPGASLQTLQYVVNFKAV